jgi:hypothetical protein
MRCTAPKIAHFIGIARDDTESRQNPCFVAHPGVGTAPILEARQLTEPTVKYFHAVNNQTAEEFVVGAEKAGQVPLAVAGSTLRITLAETKDLFTFFRGGGALHPKSRTDGPERFYLIERDGAEPVLIRAKNESEAVSLIGAIDLTIVPLKPATLVDLLSRNVRQINCEACDEGTKSETPAAAPAASTDHPAADLSGASDDSTSGDCASMPIEASGPGEGAPEQSSADEMPLEPA